MNKYFILLSVLLIMLFLTPNPYVLISFLIWYTFAHMSDLYYLGSLLYIVYNIRKDKKEKKQ